MPVLTETTDAVSGISTTYMMAAGDYFFGTLGTTGDSDWIRVDLTAGQTYSFGLVGVGALTDNLDDSYLRLRNGAGTLISEDDDSGPGLNSSITFTATITGSYYLDVQSWTNSQAGDYGVSATTGSLASYDVTMGAGVLLRPDASWAATPGTPVTVTWGIRASGTATDASGNVVPFEALSAPQIAAAQDIMAMFDGVSGLALTQVNPGGTTNSATILFGAYSSGSDGAGAFAYYPGSTSSSDNAGDVWLNNVSVSKSSLPPGSFSYFAMMHELGHSVGLAHPGDYNAAPGVSITYANSAQFIEDTHQYTVMSYFDESNTTSSLGSYPDTLLLYDIYALHQQYGADMSYHAGNTVYGFNANVGGAFDFTTNTTPLLSIWDGGGTDTLDLSGYALAQVVNLGAGTFSDVGGYQGNLSIAIGAVIENAIGGSGNDSITGNGADNRITGGAGSDTFFMALNRAQATVSQIAGGYLVVSSLGTDTLIGVEFIQFLDQSLDLSTIASGGPTTGDDTLWGSPADDVISLLSGNDSYSGGGGDDSVLGNDGNDTLNGDDGNDTLSGDDGNDLLNGGSGNDRLLGHNGEDTLNGDDGSDVLNGGRGNDLLNGGSSNDLLYGSYGDDMVNGDDGNDTLFGNDGNDTLNGNAGNDTLRGDDGNDLLNGGSGNDRLLGHDGEDTLNGDDGSDVLNGGRGNDLLNGGSSSDLLYGSYGDDTVNGDDGNDTLFGNDGTDTLNGGVGDDVLNGGDSRDRILGSFGNDVLNGEGGNDWLNGDYGSDTLFGNDGDDTLNGNAGNDTLSGDDGNDLLNGGSGNDRLLGHNGEDTLNGDDGSDVLNGGRGNDLLNGGNSNDILNGSYGNDALNGNAGNDTLSGDDGNDLLNGGSGNDRLLGHDGEDTLNGDDGSDVLNGGRGNDLLNGGNSNDILNGSYGDDSLNGGAGNDTLTGNSNADTFIFADIGGGFGADVITDFAAMNNFEKIDLSGVAAIVNLADLVANHMSQVGADVVIDALGGNRITLLGVNIGDLDANDFIF